MKSTHLWTQGETLLLYIDTNPSGDQNKLARSRMNSTLNAVAIKNSNSYLHCLGFISNEAIVGPKRALHNMSGTQTSDVLSGEAV